MKQTAVEWLEDNLIGNPFSEKDFEHNRNVFRKVKEMEKQQIMDARTKGDYFCDMPKAEQYYNETFNTEKL
jgi:hypothetical protein